MTLLRTVGDRVLQAAYGAGTVVSVNEFHTKIDFDDAGVKVFVTRKVSLQASNTIAPQPRAGRSRRRPKA